MADANDIETLQAALQDAIAIAREFDRRHELAREHIMWLRSALDGAESAMRAALVALLGVTSPSMYSVTTAANELRDWLAWLDGNDERPDESEKPRSSDLAVEVTCCATMRPDGVGLLTLPTDGDTTK